MKEFDYIVIGSGIAGLTFALKVAPHGRVAIITKKHLAEANTQYAQGGIAAVTKPTDSVDLHVADTLRAGAGLCSEEVVRTIVEEGPARVQELIDLGMDFTRGESISADGERFYSLGKEGGHSKRRVLHAKDATGREIMRALLAALERAPNVSVFEDHFAIDLITSAKLGLSGENRCVGTYVWIVTQVRWKPFARRTWCCHGRVRQGVPVHDQSGYCHRGRRGDGLSRRCAGGQHGVHPVSSYLPISSQGQILPCQ